MAEPLVGQIQAFGFSYAPQDWNLCLGQLLQVSQNAALFSLLANRYGGDGQSTFALPDLRGRTAIGMGQGPGLSNHLLAAKGGAETATLTQANLATHTHIATVASGTKIGITGTLSASDSTSVNYSQAPTPNAVLGAGTTSGGDTVAIYAPAGTTANVPLAGISISGSLGVGSITNSNTGGGMPFSILPPFLVLNFSIAISGVYPVNPN